MQTQVSFTSCAATEIVVMETPIAIRPCCGQKKMYFAMVVTDR